MATPSAGKAWTDVEISFALLFPNLFLPTVRAEVTRFLPRPHVVVIAWVLFNDLQNFTPTTFSAARQMAWGAVDSVAFTSFGVLSPRMTTQCTRHSTGFPWSASIEKLPFSFSTTSQAAAISVEYSFGVILPHQLQHPELLVCPTSGLGGPKGSSSYLRR